MASVSSKNGTQWHASVKIWHADPSLPEGGIWKRTWKQTGIASSRPRKDAQAAADVLQATANALHPSNKARSDQRAFAEALASMWRAAGLSVPQVTTNWEDFAPEWVASCTVNAASARLYQSHCNAFGQHLQHKAQGMLHNITHRDCQSFYDALRASGRTAKTARNYLKCIRAAFERAVKLGIIGLNPAALVKTPLGAPARRLPLTLGEVARVLAVLDDPPAAAVHCRGFLHGVTEEWRTAILLGLWCGMRLGDATKCKWSSIAHDVQTVTFIPEKKRRYGVAVTLPIVGALRNHLMKITRTKNADFAAGNFLTPQLAKCTKNSVNFGKLLNLAGISDERPAETGKASKPKRLRSFHSLRHTVLTELAKSGADKQIRMLLADHDDAAVNDRYTHAAVERLANALEKAFPDTGMNPYGSNMEPMD